MVSRQMKVNRIDAHDRFLKFQEQADYISRGCQDCIDNRPEEFVMPFYIFAHNRTIEMDERIAIFQDDMIRAQIDPNHNRKYMSLEEVPTSRLIWTPRLTKPTPQSNSMLFKAYPQNDNIKIIWMIPARELWGQFTKGNMTEHKIVSESIYMFNNDFEKMSAREDDDLTDTEVDLVYKIMAENKKRPKFEMI